VVVRRGDVTQYMVQTVGIILNFKIQARLGVDILDTAAAAVVADD